MNQQSQSIHDEVTTLQQAILVGGMSMSNETVLMQDLNDIKIALNKFDNHLTNYLARQDVNAGPPTNNTQVQP